MTRQEINKQWRIVAKKDKYEFTIDGDKYKLVVKNFDEKDEANYEIYLTEPDDFEISSNAKIELLPIGGKLKFISIL